MPLNRFSNLKTKNPTNLTDRKQLTSHNKIFFSDTTQLNDCQPLQLKTENGLKSVLLKHLNPINQNLLRLND